MSQSWTRSAVRHWWALVPPIEASPIQAFGDKLGGRLLVPSPAPRAQVEPSTEQVEKPLGGAFVDMEIRTQRRIEPLDGARRTMALVQHRFDGIEQRCTRGAEPVSRAATGAEQMTRPNRPRECGSRCSPTPPSLGPRLAPPRSAITPHALPQPRLGMPAYVSGAPPVFSHSRGSGNPEVWLRLCRDGESSFRHHTERGPATTARNARLCSDLKSVCGMVGSVIGSQLSVRSDQTGGLPYNAFILRQ